MKVVSVVKNQSYANGMQGAQYQKARNNRANQQVYSQSFTGVETETERILKKLPQYKSLKVLKKWQDLKGEMGGILITALGTGLVAPIFIGFNPFVKAPKNATPEEKKENENTKLYTAMRQPISAVLAIIFQASVQKYIDKGLDKVVNNPNISKYARLNLDQQELNTKTYIQANVRKEMQAEGKTEPSLIKSLFSSDAKVKRKRFIEEFDARVEKEQENQVQKIAEKFQATGKINIGERHLDSQSTAELVNKQIDTYIKESKNLQKTPEDIARYLDKADLLIKNEDSIRNAFGGIKEKTVTQDVQALLAKKETPEAVKKLLQEILDKPEDLRFNRVERTLWRIDNIKAMCNGQYSREKYNEALLDKNKVLAKRIVELTGAKIDPKSANEKTITSAIDRIIKQCSFDNVDGITKSVLCDTDTFDDDISRLTKKVYKDITKGYKKLVEHNYKSWNQLIKIGVGVFITLPITCTALNWVYPRFMDIFFPSLSGADEKKPEQNQKIGGNK